ncbi:sensor histidine kinase [Plantactinospora soyae]|uniref:histidine kinase n=1 Tax=Plantactinospora soyae TaxID=1544732 RepID=A0A927MC61_9ACTN|nr:histidine kinase [Plantactinospora soyae]MBE1490431.1 signal transduction histidine kinase [Plantactinospora soyae]
MTRNGGGWLTRSPAPPWALALLTALMTVVALSNHELPGWALTGTLLAPLTAVALLGTYPLISLSVCVTASMATALALGDAVPVWSAALSAALGVISLLAGRRMSRPAPALAVLAAGAALAIPLALIAEDAWITGLLLLVMTVALPWVLGRSIRQQAELVATTAERTRLQERTRIAHDMHDTLGHELSLMALRAGALEIAPDLEDRHRMAAADLRAGAEAATERLAEILGVLHDGEPASLQPASERIDDLVDRATQAGMAASLEWRGRRQLPPMVDRAAHRIVQEGLTNAMKHAAGTAVRVRLETADAMTLLTVTNPLLPGSRPGAGGRAGLVGLQERVRLVGGTLQAGPHDHVFEIVATLPHTRES